ncbi:MAG: efflux RND transporter periplasmic adaptor subunit [Armatimonadota bacterium]
MRNKKKISRTIKIIIIAVVVIAALVGFMMMRRAGGKKPIIQTAVVEQGMITSSVSANGVLQPITTVEVKSNVGGQVMELAVDEGDIVTAGQLIAKIDPSDSISNLQQSEADMAGSESKVKQSQYGYTMQIQQSAASIASAEHALEAEKMRLAQARNQAKVQPKLTQQAIRQAASNLASAQASYNQTKTSLIPQKLASAKSAYDQANASYTKAYNDFTRKQGLLDKGFISQSQLDISQEQYQLAKAQQDSAKSKFDTIQQESDQDLLVASAKVDQAQSALDTAKSNSVQDSIKQQELSAAVASVKQSEAALKTAKAGAYQQQMKQADITQARAQLARSSATLKNAQTQMGYTTITAPRSGVVVKKYVEIGSIIAAARSSFSGSGSGVTIVDIADNTRMMAQVNVDETDIAQIRIRQKVDVTVDAFSDRKYQGIVTKIAPQAILDQNVTTIPVTVEIENPDKRLKPQMNATCDFIIARKDNAVMVPSESITETPEGSTVTVVNKDGIQEVRKVRVGIMGNDMTEVMGGVKAGDTVVTAVIQPQGVTGGMMGGGSSKTGASGSGTRGGSSRRGMGGPGGPPPF